MMRTLTSVAALVALAAGCSTSPEPAHIGDPVEGRQVAQTLCASCHATGAADASPNPGAQPLRQVLAGRSPQQLAADLDGAKHIVFLRMPQFFLGDGHAHDLVAYIETIQAQPVTP